MANRIATPINGITTTSNYQDGDCYSLVNLRPKNGALHPVAPRKVMQELSQKYDIVFVHQNNDYKNWIGVINDETTSSIYNDILAETPTLIDTIQSKIRSIEQIGNTLSLITDSNIFYLLFNENQYLSLGNIPALEPINYFIGGAGGVSSKAYYEEYTSVTKDNFKDATIGLFNVLRRESYKDKACLFDSHLMIYAFRLFDGSIIKQSMPVLLCPKWDSRLWYKSNGTNYIHLGNTQDGESAWMNLVPYRIFLKFDLTYLENWRDIIKSVDIFVSPGLGFTTETNIIGEIVNSPEYADHPLFENQKQMIENTKSNSLFYLIDSINVGQISEFTGADIGSGSIEKEDVFVFPKHDKLSDLDNLIYNETLPIDSFSHNEISASLSYVYNNRLHLAGVNTTLFNGFNFKFFSLLPSEEYPGYSYFNGVTFLDYIGYKYDYGMLVAIDIKISGVTKTLYAATNDLSYFWINPYISYPDPRAFKARFYEISNDNKFRLIHEIDLTPSPNLNLSFYLQVNDSADRVEVPKPNNNASTFIDINTSTSHSYTENNKLKVSELNNPLYFPNINTYQVGNGSIIAMATNAIRISEGQFGQYPLYVFTTQGIYSLNVGEGEVVYSAVSAPTSYEIPTTPIVASTPFGVVFTSARGICIIRGQEVELLTASLQEAPSDLIIEFQPPMVGVIHNFKQKPFTSYLRELDNLVYDPYENELIICDKESDFNYVLNLYSQSFYQSTERIHQVVKNTFPELYVISDKILKDFQSANIDSEGNPERANVSFITRPLRYGSNYIKWLEKIFLFCTLYDTNPLIYVSHSSMDGVNFKAMAGYAPSQRGNYTTREIGTIAGNKFTCFLYSFGAILNSKSIINRIESLVSSEYSERLMK